MMSIVEEDADLAPPSRADPRIQELRRRFIAYAKPLDPRRLVFLDEAGSHIAMTRDDGRAPRGQRVLGSVPRNRGEVTTMIGALGIKGVRAFRTVEGGTDGDVFEAFIEHFLLRKLRPGAIVVLDNVGAHNPTRTRARVEAAGAQLLFLRLCSPDLNPIELGWSKLKGILKDFGARTHDALDAAIRRGIDPRRRRCQGLVHPLRLRGSWGVIRAVKVRCGPFVDSGR